MNQPKPFTPQQEALGQRLIKVMTALNVGIYRLSRGRLMGRFPGGAPVLLLTTRGRKSRQPRTVALLYLKDGDHYLIVGSKGGMSTHPAWALNLEAEARATVEVGGRKESVRARVLEDAQRDAVWPRLVSMYPSYDSYQARTPRRIRVYALDPVANAG